MAIDFEAGSSQGLSIPVPSSAVQNRTDITLGCWFLPETLANANLIGYSVNAANDTRAAMKINADGSIQGQIRAPDAGARVDGDSAAGDVVNGTQAHVVCSFNINGDDLRIFNLGAQVGDPPVLYTNANTDNNTSQAADMMCEESGVAPFQDGVQTDVLVYSKNLSLAEVQTIFFTKGALIPYFALVSRWQMKELGQGVAVPAGAVVMDQGPLQAHATRIGAPTYVAGPLRFRKQIG